MNEEALLYSFDLFTKDGYNGSQEDYFELIKTNPEALEYSYQLFQKDGYNGTIDDFTELVGVKKKDVPEDMVSISEDGSLVQPTITQPSTATEDSTLEFSDVEYEDPNLKMEVLDLAQQLPTLNYNELNEEGQQIITDIANKYNLTEDQILAQARTKKASINQAGILEAYYNSFKQLDARLGEGILSIPSVIYETAAALISDPINRALGREETNLEAFEEVIGTRKAIDALIDEQEYRQKQAEIFKKERKIEGGIAENFFQKGNIADGFFLLGESIAQSAPVSIGIMAASASGVGLIPLAVGATTVMTGPELRAQKEQFPEQSDFTNVMKAIGMAGAEMVFSTISQGTLGKVYKDIIFRQGAEAGRRTFRNGLISMYETALKKTGPVAAAAGEGIEEVATQITQNLIDGRPAYEGVPDAFLAGVGSGGVYGAPIGLINGTKAINKAIAKKKIAKKIKPTEFSDIAQVFQSDKTTDLQLDLVNTKRADEVLVSDLKRKVETGELTQEEADKIQQNFFDTATGDVKLKPLNLTTEQQTEAVDLLKRKRILEAEIKEIDDSSLSVNKQKELNDINQQLIDIVESKKPEEDAVQEPSPEEVDVQEQARDGEEVGVGDTTRDITGEITPEAVETTKVPEEEVTELTEEQKDEVSDLEYSLGLKPQKPKAKKESPVDIFFGETIEETTESLSDNLAVNRKGEVVDKSPEQIKRINSVTKIATTAAKAISKILPNTKIVLHDSTTEFQQYVTTPEAEAEYNPADNVIHVDLSKASEITVPHEVFHAVFLSKVKTDKKATRQAELLVKKLQAADLPNEVKERLDSFVERYKDSPDTKNEEKLAELMGILAEDYSKVNDVEQNMIRNFLKQLARILGLRQLENTINTDNEVLNLLNTLAERVVTGEEITEADVEILEDGTNPIGEPTEINVPRPRKSIPFKESYPLSLVTPNNRIDLLSLIKDINANKQKVWFWVADQLGLGEYDGIQLDAGPSFAFDGEAVWASSKAISEIQKNIDKADYLFIISGSPQKSLLFNKKVYDVFTKRLGDYNTFKQEALATKPIKAISDILNEFDSWEALRESPKRKTFLLGIQDQQGKPNTAFHKYVKGLDGFVNVEELRDGFYRDNNFEQNDIMVVIKPTGVREGSTHSTYANEVLGEVVGVPDTKVDAFEIMPKEIADKYREDLTRTEKAQVVAPYGSGIKEVAPKPRQRLAPIEGEAITIEGVVEQGRAQGFSDAAIKAVLIGRGFKASDINTALEEALRKGETLPAVFRTIPDGLKFFRSLRSRINRFKNTPNRKTKEKPSNAEVRQRALEILKNTDIYKGLPESQQNELVLAVDKFVGTTANRTIQREITRIKNIVRGFKKGARDLRAAQIELKNFIRNAMPKSQGYSDTDIANAIAIVTGIKSENDLPAAVEKVLKKVDAQRERIRKRTIRDIVSFINKKAKVRKTRSNKSRSAGLDAQGQQFFKNAQKILKALTSESPTEAIQAIENTLDSDLINEATQKELRGEKLTSKESNILDLALAYDMFGDLNQVSLEDAQVLLEELKQARAESIQRLNEKRAAEAERIQRLRDEGKEQVENLQSFMFETDEKGNKVLKDLEQDRKVLWDNFNKNKTWEGLKKVLKTYDFTNVPGITDYFRKRLAHLGSLVKILDNYTDGFFTKNIYDRLNIMSENSLRGYYTQQDVLNELANSIEGIDGGYRQINEILFGGAKQLTIKGKQRIYSPNELLRIYALSLNEVQRNKLIKQGFNESVLAEIEKELGPELIEFANKVVDYLSTDYFESVNDVFSEVNDVNLGYVENYFPTKTRSDSATDADLIANGDFSAVFTAENSPALRERTDVTGEVEVDKGDTFTSVLNNHIEQMERFKAYAQGVKDMNAIFNTPTIKALMETTKTKDLIRQAILFDVNPNYGLEGLKPTFISTLLSRYTSFALSFKLVQIPKQASSFINAYSEYQFRPGKNTPVLDFLGFMVDFAKVISKLPSEIKKAQEISATFRSRLEQGLAGDVYGLETGLMRLLPKTSKKISKTRQAFRTGAAAPTVLGDIIGVMGYMANYNRNIANGMSKQEALKVFNDYNATQQSRRSSDKIPLQRSNNELTRTFTMFGSTLFLQINKTMTSLTSIMKGKATTKQVRDFALNLGIANALFVLTANLAKLIQGDDEDREEVMWKMSEALIGLNLLYQVPLVGGFAESAVNGIKKDVFELPFAQRMRSNNDVVNPFNSIYFKVTRFYKEGDWGKAVIPIGELVIGAQVDPVIGLYNYFKDLDFDEGEMYDILGISKSYRPREKKPAKKPKLTID